eukprot:NODE_977_length_1190_cov_364.044698_g739_i0.p1 GENE.NODE_977_length_1190_cov_364.044698_g739_i0~~NODE_977_length_1190_cov_364.044698_g739_i0.p1  ORF type:complete len:364 (-),score=73.57 NODE_977_length_1190_cov_364.044698_g739_i0:44-1135(-)
MSCRPLVSVQNQNRSVPLPRVFRTPIRYDVIQFVHSNIALNRRQPYAVSRRAGHKTSAESWGTGRAVARIPRVSGGGTHRSGQGAFGNMCRGGRMFAPTKVFRRWHRGVPLKVRKLAIRAALAASAIPSLVMARGHNIEQVPEIPLVVSNKIEQLEKTKDAIKMLQKLGCYADCEKVAKSRHVRVGKGKKRNRRYQTRKGPMLILSKRCTANKAFRNLKGVDICNVKSLNMLGLTPGGHCGRMLIWSEDAFKKLDGIYTGKPRTTVDSKKVINSEAVQAVLRKKRPQLRKRKHSKNARRNNNPAVRIEKAQAKNYLKKLAKGMPKKKKLRGSDKLKTMKKIKRKHGHTAKRAKKAGDKKPSKK